MKNKNKKILIISPFFFPEPISTGKFNTHFVNLLKEEVKSVTILCSHPFYPEWKVKQSADTIKNITIIRGGKHVFYPKNQTLRRIILELWYALFVFVKFIKFRKKVDVIIPVFPPSLAFFVIKPLIKKETKAIAMVHDLQEVYASKKKGILNKIINFFIHQIEGKALRRCDKLIFLSNEMKNTAKEYYKLHKDKLTVQYPFITLNNERRTNDLKDLLPLDTKHIVYSGALGEKQNPKQLYSFFNEATKNTQNTLFHFFSQGTVFELLKKKNTNKKIRFHKLVPKENIEELYKRSTIQIIPQKEGTSKGSLPSKLPNILASGCNILIITDKNSELDNLFKKYNLNTVVTLWDNELLCSTINSLLENNGSDTGSIKTAKELFNNKSIIDKILS